MKIIAVNTNYYQNKHGGAEISIQYLYELLSNLGHEITIVTSDAVGINSEEIINGVQVIRLKSLFFNKKLPIFLKKIIHILDAYNYYKKFQFNKIIKIKIPDIIVFHNLTGFSVSVIAAADILKIPTVHVLHDMYGICPKKMMYRGGKKCKNQCIECMILRAPYRKITNKVNGVVGISKFIIKVYEKYNYLQDVKLKKIIHNYRPNLSDNQKEIGQWDGVCKIGFLGSLYSHKGVDKLILSFTSNQSMREKHLYIAGNGDIELLKRIIDDNGAKNITLVGKVNSTEFLTKIDVLVVPSQWNEPLGMVAVESISMGIPVISTANGGLGEIVKDKYNGIIIKDDLSDLNNAIDYLNIKENYQKLSTNALLSAKKFQSKFNFTAEYIKFFKEVIEEFKKQ